MLTTSSQKLSKGAAAIGGFPISVGTTIIGVSALAFSGVIDVSLLKEYQKMKDIETLALGVLLVIGIHDVVSGVILRRR